MKGPFKAIWEFEGIYAQSRHIPGVRFAGSTLYSALCWSSQILHN